MKIIVFLIAVLVFTIACEKEEQYGELRIPPSVPLSFRNNLPRPFLEKHQHFTEMYWKSWELLNQKIINGNSKNNFVDRYIDEGFNDLIYQWDTCFMVMFSIYGGELFPSMASLDNFYQKQRADGWICRVYQEADGEPPALPAAEDPMINPPLFAYVEWKYYLLTGDDSRFGRVLPILDAYYNWIDENAKAQLAAAGLYFNSHLGSGMDNSPRHNIKQAGWVDLSAQMALFAKYMMFMAREIQHEGFNNTYQQRYRLLVRVINGKMWDDNTQFYYDFTKDGKQLKVKTVAAFWTLLSEVATFPQARKLAEHLQNPDEFYRLHLFPSLSADEKLYDSQGYYWRGGVWAPMNYMIIKGLDIYPLRELAAAAAYNHIDNIYKVYKNFQPLPEMIAAEERDDAYQTIWECYSPDEIKPATRWDGKYLSRQDFVGWSGLGPIALLLENIIGLQPSAPKDVLYWNLRIREKHGVENYRFGDNQIDIICQKNELPVNNAIIHINSNSPFGLVISSQVGVKEFEVKKGENVFELSI